MPFLLLGSTIIFWGWQLNILPFAAAMALAVESTRFLTWKCNFSRKDFRYFSDLCSILLLGMIIYIIASNRSSKTLLVIMKWLPLPLYPLVLSQLISTSGRIELGSLISLYRKRKSGRPEILSKKVDVSYPYAAICILSATVANNRSVAFYAVFCLLAAWALYCFRSKRFSLSSWISLIVLVAVLGYFGHVTLHYLQRQLEETVTRWVSELIGFGTDPYKSATSMGDTLELKHSSKIIARVIPRDSKKPPKFLRTATYNIFRTSVWFDSTPYFRPVFYDSKSRSWRISTPHGKRKESTIYFYLDKGYGILPVPAGTYRIARLYVARAEINRLGTIKVQEGPELISYDAFYCEDYLNDSAPHPNDLRVPPNEEEALDEIARKLGLYSMDPDKAVNKIDGFFRSNFTYSLKPPVPARNGLTPLSFFLLKSHRGHCEYFATATALLLRKIGIPARYATGYVVREYSRWEKMYIVRQRHAHAWAIAYINGKWQNIDTTPQAWFVYDKSLAPDWEPLYDLWAQIMFIYYKWKWGERKNLVSGHAIFWLIIPLLLFLAVRLYRKKGLVRQLHVRKGEKGKRRISVQGRDSELYSVVEILKQMGYERQPWESMKGWIEKISKSPTLEKRNGNLKEILELHYRYRFDPKGLKKKEREKLKILVKDWKERIRDK